MKKLMTLMPALLMALALHAQSDSLLNAYGEQYVRLSKIYAKTPDNVANLLEMSDFFINSENPHYSLTLAAEYCRRAESLYVEYLKDKDRYRDLQKLIRKGITLPVIRQKGANIESQAVLYVRSHVPQMESAELEAFLKAFPDNEEIGKRLRAKALAARYEQVCRENTIKGYYAFSTAYKGTAEADSAEAALARLAPRYFSACATEMAADSAAAAYPASNAMQRAAMRQKSRIAYAAACEENTVEAYSAYLERYPRGDDYIDALSRLQRLRNSDFGLLQTPEELADYAEANAEAALADSALAKLRRMAVEEHSRAAAEIYLSRFPLDEEYSNVYKAYYSWYASEGNRTPIEDFAASNPNYPYQLTVQSDLARGKVIDSFDLARTFTAADYDYLTDAVRLLTGRKAAYVALLRMLQPQIAAKDWSGALKRMQHFDLCFEDVGVEEYAELASLLSANGGMAAKAELVGDSVERYMANPANGLVYYCYTKDGQRHIGFLSRTKSGWHRDGEVAAGGYEKTASVYNFYNGGTQALLGINGDIWTAKVVSDSVWIVEGQLPWPVNTPYLEQDAYMLEDGSGLLLASDRPEGFNVQKSGTYYHGDRAAALDIYYFPLTEGSHWGEAVNLGPSVNTPYCDHSPLLSRNMRTLYYITDARGLGFGDVYKTTRTDVADWQHWSKPVNLGRMANSAFDETAIVFGTNEKSILLTAQTAKGRQAMSAIATQHDTASGSRQLLADISEVSLMLRRMELVETWNQHTADSRGDRNLDSIQAYRLYKGKDYAIICVADWIYIPTLHIDGDTRSMVVLHGYSQSQLKEMAEPLPLHLVKFHSTTARLLPMGEKELKGVAHFLSQHQGCTVEIAVGVNGSDAKASYELSLERAASIRTYFALNGIDAERVKVSAYGNVPFKEGEMPAEVTVLFR